MSSKNGRVIVIGAGIFGATAAYYLAQAGVETFLIDREGPAAKASGDNGGALSPMPGVGTGTVAFLRRSLQALYDLESELDDSSDLSRELAREGWVMTALTDEDWEVKQKVAVDARSVGVDAEVLDGDSVRELDPALGEAVIGGVYVPDGAYVHPVAATLAFAEGAERLGARTKYGTTVTGFEMDGDRVIGVRTDKEVYYADEVVLAAGPWSTALAASIGLNLPVVPAKGHMLATTHLPPVSRRMFLGSLGGIRQWASGQVILGSNIQYLGFDDTIDRSQVSKFYGQALLTVPALREAKIAAIWTGLRPMSPDNLPILGAAPNVAGLWISTGGSTTGMMYGPGAGLAIRDLILDGTTDLPLDKLTIERFPNVDGRMFFNIEMGGYFDRTVAESRVE